MTRRVAIAGVAAAYGAKGEDVTPYGLIAKASRQALAQSGLAPGDVDGVGSTGLGTLPPIDVAEYLGLRPRWIDSTGVGVVAEPR